MKSLSKKNFRNKINTWSKKPMKISFIYKNYGLPYARFMGNKKKTIVSALEHKLKITEDPIYHNVVKLKNVIIHKI